MALERFGEAWRAFYGPQQRLWRLSATAVALVDVLRRMHDAGMTAASSTEEGAWSAPIELRRGSPRFPAAEGWQAVDRAMDALTACLAAPDSTLLARAVAVEQLARAAQQLADSLPNAAPVSTVAVCAFCGKPGDQVKTIIAGNAAFICNECVDMSVDILEEQLGDDWRTPPA
jgi:ClpX C4-type zinc finger